MSVSTWRQNCALTSKQLVSFVLRKSKSTRRSVLGVILVSEPTQLILNVAVYIISISRKNNLLSIGWQWSAAGVGFNLNADMALVKVEKIECRHHLSNNIIIAVFRY